MSDPVPLPILSAPIAVSSTIPESPCIKILDFLGVQDFIDPNIYGFRHTSETQYLLYRSQATNHTLQIWDMNSFELVSVVDAQILPTRVRSWTLTNDRNALVIAFCSIDTCTIKWYDLHSRKFVRTLELPGNNKEYEIEESMLITYDGRKLIRVFDSEIRIFDLRTGIMLRSTAAHDLAKGYFTEIVGSYPNLDRHEILTYATNEVAAVWRASDDSFELVTGPFRLGVHSISGRTSIRFTGDRIIYENPDGGLTIGYFENGQFQVEVQHSSPQAQFPRNYSLSSDCQMFAVRYPGSGTMFVIRNAYSGNIIAGPLPYDDEIWQWGFSPDGKHFTTSSRSRIRVWDVEAAIEQYRIANAPLANSSLPKEKETLNFRSTGQFQHDGPRRRSSSSDHSLLSLPATSEPERSTAPPADNVVASEVLSIFYGRQRERRNQIDFDSLLDVRLITSSRLSLSTESESEFAHLSASCYRCPGSPSRARTLFSRS
ncbi:hypothetical protein BJ138DRAFT_955419 [Hygrophoropsis aurantiaca]|uniref:Uncharacterized protein n=1 Tax=Hygrophoropsis aurantiaca TaxID=72124 RepID=A0ACB8ACF2_9AGAM|nr:hypothetical protein BJ138DRAFT_955419 [Hygrophoropsis aurantiaca]